ncbi:hypothetical protein LX36DRAFT_359113 [Colletotrichum falcatum]|nr:hypothetical protein LX36DRAFT_359113 [Colletotrichum falcatum]
MIANHPRTRRLPPCPSPPMGLSVRSSCLDNLLHRPLSSLGRRIGLHKGPGPIAADRAAHTTSTQLLRMSHPSRFPREPRVAHRWIGEDGAGIIPYPVRHNRRAAVFCRVCRGTRRLHRRPGGGHLTVYQHALSALAAQSTCGNLLDNMFPLYTNAVSQRLGYGAVESRLGPDPVV